MILAGIGSRAVPQEIASRGRSVACALTLAGHRFRSGGACGMDSAWEEGSRSAVAIDSSQAVCQVFRPHGVIPERAFEIACKYHNHWHRCKPFVRRLMARNAQIILGGNLDEPADAVLYWMPPGGSRGTEHSLRIARGYDIRVVHLDALGEDSVGGFTTILGGDQGHDQIEW